MKKSKRILSMALTVLLLVSLLVPALSFADSKGENGNTKGGQPSWVIDKLKDKFEFMDGNKIKFNNMNTKFDVPPVIKDGRTLIPVRAIEAMGAKVLWDPALKLVTITKDDVRIFMDLLNGKVYVTDADTLFKNVTSEDEVAIDVKPGLINNRTFVPLRFIAEKLGLKVDYDNGNINVQDQPKITPTKFVFQTESEIASGAAITVMLNTYDFDSIKGLTKDVDYIYDPDKKLVTLTKTYLEKITTETTKLTFVFDKADVPNVERELELKMIYNALEKPELSIDDATFTKSTPAAVTVTMDPNDYTFLRIEQNNTTFTTYDKSSNTITFTVDYLEDLTSDMVYYFVFENGGIELKVKFEIEIE